MDIPVGIVTYNPDIVRLRENINAVYNAAAVVIIADNGSVNSKEIQTLISEYDRIVFLSNDVNKGIAAALNQLCEEAVNRKYSYILTLDQDSVCPDNLCAEFSKYTGRQDAGIICPAIRDRNHNLDVINNKVETEEINRCITSGSLVMLKVWSEIGGFDESMFIDGVDFDFCNRMRARGYIVLRVNKVVLLHEIGNIEIRHFLFFKVRVKNHSSFRKYYIARNTVYQARKQKKAALIFKAHLQVIKQYFMVLLYEDDKKKKLHEIVRGFKDGKKVAIDERWI